MTSSNQKTSQGLPVQMDMLTNDPTEAFRRLYYHLYSNSRVSRADRLIHDLSLLLLSKYSFEINGGSAELEEFIKNGGDADKLLLGHLRATCPGIVQDNDCFSIDSEILRVALADLQHVSLAQTPAHLLGDAFQALIGPRLRGEKGQFFTPRSLVRAMIEILNPKPGETVLDPACGTGGFLIETWAFRQAHYESPEGDILGLDKDADLARFAGAMIHITSGLSHIFCANSLDPNQWPVSWPDAADVILTNPPFGARIGVTDPHLLASYSLGHRWLPGNSEWQQTDDILDSQDPQVLFLELCVSRLKHGGRMAIVLPEGLFGNKRAGFIWDWLRQQGQVTGLLDCPRTTFQPGTDTKTNVLFFRRGEPSEIASTRVAVALYCGHDRRGKTTSSDGKPCRDDFSRLASAFHKESSEWKSVTTRPYYLVPRYYMDQKPIDPWERDLIAGAPLLTLAELENQGWLTIRKGVEVGAEAYGTGSIPFVRTSDIANFEIRIDPTTSVDFATYERAASQLELQAGDVLLVVDGRYRIGQTALITEGNRQCVIQSHLRLLGTPNHEQLTPHALLFALNLPSVKLRVRNLVFIQSTLGTLGSRLRELQIPLLTGDGPWDIALQRFRSALATRDKELAALTDLSRGDEILL